MKGLGNTHQMCYIQINKEKLYSDIQYLQEKKGFFGNIIREEGFYKLELNFPEKEWIKLDKIPNFIKLNNKDAIEKCHIIIEYTSKRREKIYFDGENEMINFVKMNFQGREWKIFD